jgi:hypothetical protein
MATLHPRDERCVTGLRERGLLLVNLTIPPVSPLIGQRVFSLPLPPDTRILCLTRGPQTYMELEQLPLQAGDGLFVLSKRVKELRQAFLLDR